MLLFSTILELNSKMNRDSFIDLIIEWNQNSPHAENIIPGLQWNGTTSVKQGNESVWIDIKDYSKESTIAVRYEKREQDGVIWDTDYVMNFRNMKLCIRLERNYTEDALLSENKFSTPHFIAMLIDRGFLKKDADLPIIRDPIYVGESLIDLLSNIILGKANYKYPIVYVSKTYYDEDPVDVSVLANRLRGVAHVLVQESNYTNLSIKEKTKMKNEYYGAIGIYYPNHTYKHKRYLYRRNTGFDSHLIDRIIKDVMLYNNSQLVSNLFTWQGVNNALLLESLNAQSAARIVEEKARKKFEAEASELKEQLNDKEKMIRENALNEAKSEANALIECFDEEMDKLKRQVSELTATNESLQNENHGLRNKLNSIDFAPLLTFGDEYDFYDGEIKDLILSALSESLESLPDRSRRRDVIKDVIKNNNYLKISEKKADDIKRMLKSYNGMTAKLKQDLEAYGFEINEEGKHYKILYYGDARYSEILSKTPSDYRTGKTSSLKLKKIAF